MAAVLVAAGPAYPDTGSESFGERHGCDHLHPSRLAYGRIRDLVRHTNPVVRKARVQHYATCLETRAKAHRAHELARKWWKWRHRYAQRWVIVFNRLPSWDQSWARSTSMCESGMSPTAYNPAGPFFGAFQFMLATWASAGGTGNPTSHSWHYQAVIAVRWMHVAGKGQWPVCSYR